MYVRRAGVVMVAATLTAALAAVAPGANAGPATPLSLAPSANLGDGASSWFQGPRAIMTNDGCALTASSVGGAGANGDVNVSTWTLGAQERSTATLDQSLFHDDHNAPGLVQLANGELLAAWSGHAQDTRVRAAVRSTTGRWTSLSGFSTFGLTTYNNVYQRSDGTVLDFVRHQDATTLSYNPDVYSSADNGRTWSALGQLLYFSGSRRRQRPYVRYAQLGDRISFITTQGHPRELDAVGIDAAIYAGYLEGTTIFRNDGTAIGTLGTGVEVTALTPVYVPAPNHGAWTSDLSFATDGTPIAVFSVRDRNVAWDSPLAIRYLQARYLNGAWVTYDIGPGGRALYAAEDDYPGTVATDPVDPDHVVVSSTVDPTSGVNRTQFDLFDGHSTTGGATWSWTRLTNTSNDELRPDLTNAADGAQGLVWFAGRYDTYMSYATTVRARILDARSPADRAARCGSPHDIGSRLIGGDFDGDAKADVLSYRPGSSDHRISWGAARPDALVAGLGISVGGQYQPFAGDFDGDGRDDIFWYTPGAGADSIWWSKAGRTFSSTPKAMAGDFRPIAGDFNGDGTDDIYWYAPGAAADSLWWGNASQTFGVVPATRGSSYRPVAGDFNGDGADDIYWYAPGAAGDVISWGSGTGRFTSATATRGSSYQPVAGDFDGDGPDDIYWYAPGAAGDVISWGSGTGRFTSAPGPWR